MARRPFQFFGPTGSRYGQGPQHHPAALARFTGRSKPAYRLSAKHYGAKAPTC